MIWACGKVKKGGRARVEARNEDELYVVTGRVRLPPNRGRAGSRCCSAGSVDLCAPF